jgi:hypothetical protein
MQHHDTIGTGPTKCVFCGELIVGEDAWARVAGWRNAGTGDFELKRQTGEHAHEACLVRSTAVERPSDGD